VSSTIQTLLSSVERLGAEIDWAEVENYARERQHPLSTEQRRAARIAADDARIEKRRTRKVRAAQRDLARIDSALAELDS
jgi:hypothetical protein